MLFDLKNLKFDIVQYVKDPILHLLLNNKYKIKGYKKYIEYKPVRFDLDWLSSEEINIITEGGIYRNIFEKYHYQFDKTDNMYKSSLYCKTSQYSIQVKFDESYNSIKCFYSFVLDEHQMREIFFRYYPRKECCNFVNYCCYVMIATNGNFRIDVNHVDLSVDDMTTSKGWTTCTLPYVNIKTGEIFNTTFKNLKHRKTYSNMIQPYLNETTVIQLKPYFDELKDIIPKRIFFEEKQKELHGDITDFH